MYQLRNDASRKAHPIPPLPEPPRQRGNPMLFGIIAMTMIMLPRPQEMISFLGYLQLGKVALVLCLFCLVASKVKSPTAWRKLPQITILIAFAGWLLVSAVFGIWPSNSIALTITYARTLLFFFLMVMSIYTMSDLSKVIWAVLVFMVPFSMSIIGNSAMQRATFGGVTYDPNDAALLIAMLVPFYYYYYRSNKGWRRAFTLSGIVLSVAAVLLTASRGGFLALCSVLLYAFFVDKQHAMKKIVIAVLFLALVVGFMPQGLKERFTRVESAEDYNLTSRHGRLMVWQRALSIVKEHPLTGIGIGNFTFADSAVNNRSKGVVAHNFLLQVAAAMGIPGVALMLALFFFSWRQARLLRMRLASQGRSLALTVLSGLECAWVAFFIGGQFLSLAFGSQIIFLAGCSAVVWKCNLRGDFTRREKPPEAAYA